MSEPSVHDNARRVRAWIDAPPEANWNKFWSEGAQSPGEAFYQALYQHGRVNPGQAMQALARLDRGALDQIPVRERALLSRMRGHLSKGIGNHLDAHTAYARAWSQFESAGLQEDQVRTGLGWIGALAQLGRYEEAQALADRCLEMYQGSDTRFRLELLANKTTVFLHSGRFREGARNLLGILDELEQHSTPVNMGLHWCNAGHLLLFSGDVPRGREYLKKSLHVFEQAGLQGSSLYPRSLEGIARILMGEWPEGMAELRSTLEESTKLGDVRLAAAIERQQADFLFSVGALREAEHLAARALISYGELGFEGAAAHAALIHGRILATMNRNIDARARLQEALAYWDRSGNLWRYRVAQVELAAVHLERSEPAEAIRLLRGLLKYLARRDRHGVSVRGRHLLARAYLAVGKPGLAHRLATSAYDDATAYPSKLDRPWIAHTRAECLQERGESKQALAWADRAIESMDDIYLMLGSRAMRNEVAGSRDQAYRSAIHLQLKNGSRNSTRRALDLVCRSRTPALVEDLSRGTNLTSPFQSAISKLRDELSAVSEAAPSSTRMQEIGAEIEELNANLMMALTQSPPIIKQALDGGSLAAWAPRLMGRTLVLYDQEGNDWCAYVVDSEQSVRRVELPNAARSLSADWLRLRMLIESAAHQPSTRRQMFLDRTGDEATAALNNLCHSLWTPLEIQAGEVIVVPDGALHGVPLEAIANVNAETIAVSRCAHPSLLGDAASARGSRHGRAVVLRNQAEGTQAEGHALTSLFAQHGLQTEVLTRRAEFSALNKPLDVLHVAAHGQHSRDQWLLNGIELSDGWLGMESLRGPAARGSLMFLASCESGLATEGPGAEFGSWIAAGLGAGAREMVLTLWKVDDASTLEFASHFYNAWCAGEPAHRAATVARERVRQTLPHPFQWAPYLAVS